MFTVKTFRALVFLALAVIGGGVTLQRLAAEDLKPRSLGMNLADEIMADNPDLLFVLIHAKLPGSEKYGVIATDSSRLGKLGDEDNPTDNVIRTDKAILVDPKVGLRETRCSVHLPVIDSAGIRLDAFWTFSFKSAPTMYHAQYLLRGEQILRKWSCKVPSLQALYETASP